MTAVVLLTALLWMGEKEDFLKPGDHIWVGHGMAEGYGLPFGKKLTIKKVRVLIMKEARVVFEEYPNRYYLRTDFPASYAFREEPKQTYGLTPEEWETIRRGEITLGMSKRMFLMIKPKSDEIFYRYGAGSPIEQWIYREHYKPLYGKTYQNPPTNIYFFQDDVLISIM